MNRGLYKSMGIFHETKASSSRIGIAMAEAIGTANDGPKERKKRLLARKKTIRPLLRGGMKDPWNIYDSVWQSRWRPF